MDFRQELRQPIDKHIGPSSTFEDYVRITTDLDEEKVRLDMEAETFPEEVVNAASVRADNHRPAAGGPRW